MRYHLVSKETKEIVSTINLRTKEAYEVVRDQAESLGYWLESAE